MKRNVLISFFFCLKVEDIKKISEYVAQLRRVGKGHGLLLVPYKSNWLIHYSHIFGEIEVMLLDL